MSAGTYEGVGGPNPAHTMIIGYDDEAFTASLHCHVVDGWCRTEPEPGCFCEDFTPGRDVRGWFHEYDDGERIAQHRHRPIDYCAKIEHIDSGDGAIWLGTKIDFITRVPIEFAWNEDGYYTWKINKEQLR